MRGDLTVYAACHAIPRRPKLIRKDIFPHGTRRCWQPNWVPGQEDPRSPDGSDWKPSPNERMMDIWSSSAG